MRTRLVLFVGRDLTARSRLEAAATSAGAEFGTADWSKVAGTTFDADTLVVVDLDEAGLPPEGAALPRTVGYFSHVDEPLGRAARERGLITTPRSRFWRELKDLLET